MADAILVYRMREKIRLAGAVVVMGLLKAGSAHAVDVTAELRCERALHSFAPSDSHAQLILDGSPDANLVAVGAPDGKGYFIFRGNGDILFVKVEAKKSRDPKARVAVILDQGTHSLFVSGDQVSAAPALRWTHEDEQPAESKPKFVLTHPVPVTDPAQVAAAKRALAEDSARLARAVSDQLGKNEDQQLVNAMAPLQDCKANIPEVANVLNKSSGEHACEKEGPLRCAVEVDAPGSAPEAYKFLHQRDPASPPNQGSGGSNGAQLPPH